jgi:hypothetical protein
VLINNYHNYVIKSCQLKKHQVSLYINIVKKLLDPNIMINLKWKELLKEFLPIEF